ncbi:MAG: helix-turn-helix transcriptional regulator [Bacteroidota bacterium]
MTLITPIHQYTNIPIHLYTYTPIQSMTLITSDKELLNDIGQRIKSIRIRKRMTQNALALNCDMDKSTISKIESGRVNLSYLTLWRLSKCLEVDLGEILS